MKKVLKKAQEIIKKNETNILVLGVCLVAVALISKFVIDEDDSQE